MDILLVEDNETIIRGLEYSFNKNGYNLVSKMCITDAISYLEKNTPKLVILDICLPDGDGFSLFKNYINKKEISTIFLTARDDEDDVINGLNIGAEDYMTKPFSTNELIARVNKIILRNKKNKIVQVEDIKFDFERMIVYKNDDIINVSSLELKILHLLFSNINKVVKRETILDKIWEWTGNDVDCHTVTVYLKRIREKIETDIIVTIKGIGYRIDEK